MQSVRFSMSGSKNQVTQVTRKPRTKKADKTAAAETAVESPPLQPAEARAVLQKHLTNIVRKAAAGKTLSEREQREISRFAETGSEPGTAPTTPAQTEWVSSYEQLGRILGLHRASFPRIRRDKPDAPKPRANGDHNVNAWREFLAAHPEIQCRSEASGPAKSDLEIEKLKEQCRRLKFENDREAGLYLLKSEVNDWLIETIETIKAKLPAKLLNELPPKLEGLRAAEIAAKLEPIIAEICALLRFVHAKE